MSSHNGGRSPKDLHHLLSVAQQEDSFFPEEIEVNLAKLKTLPKDELSESAMLRGRIEQQSELICALKRQADNSLNKSLALEKSVKDLQNAKEEAVCKYNEQIRKYGVLERRFEVLFHNHEEIIKIKDEYKAVNDELRRENEKLLNRKSEDETARIKEQKSTKASLNRELVTLGAKVQEGEEQFRNLKEQFTLSEKQSCDLIEKLKVQVSNAEQKAQEMEKREQSITLQLLSTEKKMKKLLEENENYAQAALDQKQTTNEQQQKITELREKVKELESSLKKHAEMFRKQLEDASADAQVQKLKKTLKKAEEKLGNHDKEFLAYRTHTEKLLSKERELNAKLRELIG